MTIGRFGTLKNLGQRTALPYLALLSVCIFWGTTYTTIRMALEDLTPLQLIATRFLASGLLLALYARWRGHRFPQGQDLLRSALIGMLMLGIANFILTYSETFVPSGMAALFLTTAPFWLTGLEALQPKGERLTLPVFLGLLVGLAGTVLLVMPKSGEHLDFGSSLLQGFLLLQIGSFTWNAGSILQRRWKNDAPLLVNGAVHQLAVGGLALLLSFALPGHAAQWGQIHFSQQGFFGLLWLIVFGSLVGYSSYIYALATLPVSLVSIYTYVNPVVAVALGRFFFSEPFGLREYVAMAIIFVGVAIVKWSTLRKSNKESGSTTSAPATRSSPDDGNANAHPPSDNSAAERPAR